MLWQQTCQFWAAYNKDSLLIHIVSKGVSFTLYNSETLLPSCSFLIWKPLLPASLMTEIIENHPGLLNSHRWKVTNLPWINVLQKHITSTSPQWMLENVGEHMGCWLALVIFSRMVNEFDQGNIRSACQIHYDSSGLLTPCAVFPPDMWG